MSKPKSVIIIGAGLAGLAAANLLKQHEIPVKILEARNRIGGRTYTDYSFPVPFDQGAFIIHGLQHNPMVELSKTFGVKHTPLTMDSVSIINSRNQFTPEELQIRHDQYHLLLRRAGELALKGKEDMPLEKAINMALTQHLYPDLSPEFRRWEALFLTLYTGAGEKYLSARYWDLEVRLEGGNHLMLNGYQPIVDGLAQGLDIELEAHVTHITDKPHHVHIKTARKTYEADAVIITVPLGVLKAKHIKFTPELPHFKQHAIQHLGMGLLNKFMFEFPHAFWEADQIISYFAEEYKTFAWFNNFQQFFGKPVLLAALGGDVARDMEQLTDRETEAEAMRVLRNLFGNDIPNPTRMALTRWQQDPYAHGAYSYLPVGANGGDYDNMAQPVGNKIFFAGEATHSEYPATTHGAYLSGIREATRVVGVFQ